MPERYGTLRLLLVEDNPGDALLLEELLLEVPDFSFVLEHVQTAREAVERLESDGIDAILLDLSLPDAQGLQSVQKVCPAAPRIPIVVMSGLASEWLAVEALKEGAQDYLIKGEATGRVIARTVRYALERTRTAVELKAAQARAEVLAALSDALQAARSPDEVARLAVERLGTALEATFMFVLRVRGGEVQMGAAWGEVDPQVRAFFGHGALRLEDLTVLQQAALTGHGVYLLENTPERWQQPGFPRVACGTEPIRDGAGLEGFFTAWRPLESGPWTTGERELMSRAAAAVRLALERAEMQTLLEQRNAALERSTQEALRAAQMVAWEWDIARNRVRFSQERPTPGSLETHEQELNSEDVWKRIHPEDFRLYRLHLESLFAGAEHSSLRFRLRGEDGRYRWVEENVLARREGTRLAQLLGLTRDIHEQREAELERDTFFVQLEQERLQLEAILRELPVGVALAEGQSGRILLANARAGEILGRDTATLESESIGHHGVYGFLTAEGTLVPPEELPLARAVQRDEYLREAEYVYRRPDGEELILSVNTGPVQGEGSGQAGALITLRDITERRLASRRIETSEARFRLYADNLQDVLWIVQPLSAEVVFISKAFSQIWGLPLEALKQDWNLWFESIHPEDRERVRQHFYADVSQGRYDQEYRVVRPGGTVRWVRDRGFLLEQQAGLEGLAAGIAQDITERKLAELARQESDERLGLALDSSGVVFWEWDERRQKIFFDGQADALFGLKAGVRWMTTPEFKTHMLEEDRPTFEASIREALERGSSSVDYRILRSGRDSGREVRWIQARHRSLSRAGGQSLINGVFLDITERKLIELRLREVNEVQKRFVSDAAHELRAPLTAIQGNLELVRLYPQMTDSERQETVQDAEREAARLGRLVSDLLTLARGDRGLAVLEDDVRLEEVLEEAWRTAAPLGRGHRMILGPLEPCEVLGDRDRLKQLAFILLENAIKYTPEGGQIKLSLELHGEFAEFLVQDSGPGIPLEDLERVFERFYRTDVARVRGEDPGGTGLGLSIARWIAESHGGRVWLESEAGCGTLARVQLPRYSSSVIPPSSDPATLQQH